MDLSQVGQLEDLVHLPEAILIRYLGSIFKPELDGFIGPSKPTRIYSKQTQKPTCHMWVINVVLVSVIEVFRLWTPTWTKTYAHEHLEFAHHDFRANIAIGLLVRSLGGML